MPGIFLHDTPCPLCGSKHHNSALACPYLGVFPAPDLREGEELGGGNA